VSTENTPYARAEDRPRRGIPRTRARPILSRSLLRCGNFLLQKCAIPRNAAQIGLVRFTYEKHATQCGANVRKTR